MNRRLLTLIALLGLTTWAYAVEHKWELRERDNTYDVYIDASNVIQGATLNGNAATSSALAADPADCSANQYANAIGASGALSCSAISDADVPNNITIDNASTADALSANGANCSAGNYPLGVDAAGAAESCTADDDQPDSDAEVPDNITVSGGQVSNSDLTLKQSATPAPTVEGRIEWDTDDDQIVVGDGVGSKVFYSGAHTVDTNANTICSGTNTYLDGEGNCDDISGFYQPLNSVLSRFQLADTSANICAATPTGAGYVALSTDEFDMFVSTGASAGDWRNSRTGSGACQ